MSFLSKSSFHHTGIKPVPCSWKKWDLHFLEKSDPFSKGNVTLPLENQPNGMLKHSAYL